MNGGVFRKYLSILFKTMFGVFPPATCWRVVFFMFLIKKKSLCSWGKLGLTQKRIIFMNLSHESFPILVFDGSLSIEIALYWSAKDTIMWLISVLLGIFHDSHHEQYSRRNCLLSIVWKKTRMKILTKFLENLRKRNARKGISQWQR